LDVVDDDEPDEVEGVEELEELDSFEEPELPESFVAAGVLLPLWALSFDVPASLPPFDLSLEPCDSLLGVF